MKAIIFNSGSGKRMGRLTQDKPKGMLPLYNGESIFGRQIRILCECGLREFVVTTGPFAGCFQAAAEKMKEKYEDCRFTFVPNPDYDRTNYIVSMDYAYDYLDDDFLFLHGDLVFNKALVRKLLAKSEPAVCLFHEDKELPEKDFKGRFREDYLLEAGIHLFDEDCRTLQPLYKLDKETLERWKQKAREFVKQGRTGVYAEDALNEIAPALKIKGMSYREDYIDEIDTEQDYKRVSEEIKYFDYREQETLTSQDLRQTLHTVLAERNARNVFVVSGKTYEKQIAGLLQESGYGCTVFTGFSPNPRYEEIQKGMEAFGEKKFDTLLAIGGGSALDTAKCIKFFAAAEGDFIAVPTTAGSGSEATRFAVMYYQGEKQSVTHDSLIPQSVILHWRLLETLPDYQKKSTLLDALCQAVESYWAKAGDKESRAYARQAIRLILDNYQGYMNGDAPCMEAIMLASNLAGRAINISMTTAPHAMSYMLTTLYGIGHGHAVALTLPYVWGLIAGTDREDVQTNLKQLAQIFNCKTTQEAICRFTALLGALEMPSVTVPETDIPKLVDSVNPERLANTPVPVSKEQLEAIYRSIGTVRH